MRGSLWFIPVVCVGADVALSFITLWIDSRYEADVVAGNAMPAAAVLGAG